MGVSQLSKYVWLVDLLLSCGTLRFEEIAERWLQSGLCCGDELSVRTFHNHRKAIADIFSIDIECESKGKDSFYYIANADAIENDKLRGWLIDSYTAINQITAFPELSERIQFENVPSGRKWLGPIVTAMRNNHVIKLIYESYLHRDAKSIEVEPYGLKLYHQRWYLIGKNIADSRILTYSLDRMAELKETEQGFGLPEDFSLDKFYDGCVGIMQDSKFPKERIRLKAYGYACDYLQSLPLHSSQRKIDEDNDSITFEYDVCPTYDFLISVLQQGSQVEIIYPDTVRERISAVIDDMKQRYTK